MLKFGNLLQQTMSSLENMSNWQLYQSFTDINKTLWTKLQLVRRRNQIPSISETNLYFANNMLIAFCVQPPAIFLHSAGKFPSCLWLINKKLFNPVILQAQHFVCRNAFEVIVQTRVGLSPIFKHREELKIQGEVEYFLTRFEAFWNRMKSSLRVSECTS